MGASDAAVGLVRPRAAARAEPLVHVHPGHLAVARGHQPLATVLGSCVSICLHDPASRIGGLNHFVLPQGDEDAAPTRYAPGAFQALLEQMLLAGARRSRLVARIAGGANVLGAFTASSEHLGLRNARAASALLAEQRVPVVATDIGGTRGRRLLFFPDDGRWDVQLLGR